MEVINYGDDTISYEDAEQEEALDLRVGAGACANLQPFFTKEEMMYRYWCGVPPPPTQVKTGCTCVDYRTFEDIETELFCTCGYY